MRYRTSGSDQPAADPGCSNDWVLVAVREVAKVLFLVYSQKRHCPGHKPQAEEEAE